MWFEPMFLHEPSILGVPLPFVILAVGGVGAIIGLLWIRRITGLDEDPGRSIFRDREHGVGWHLAELHDLVPGLLAVGIALPMPIRRRLTVRWLATRLELTVAILTVALTAGLLLLSPPSSRPMSMSLGLDLATPMFLAGSIGCIVGLIWMVRIAWGDPDAGPSIWRSRRD